MDYVYVCRDGDNEELRYSIRSIEKNMPEGKIWVIGGKPDWYTGNFVHVEQTKKSYANVREQLRVACATEKISDDFVLMNDDFFVINPVKEIPTWYTGTLVDRIRSLQQIKSQNAGYLRLLILSNNVIRRTGVADPLDYELHTPMIMNKEKLLPILHSTALWRSYYGNKYNVGGTKHSDVKVHSKDVLEDRAKNLIDITNEPYISGSDYNFEFLKDIILGEMFSQPSKYESP
jgi:hypothetical protein